MILFKHPKLYRVIESFSKLFLENPSLYKNIYQLYNKFIPLLNQEFNSEQKDFIFLEYPKLIRLEFVITKSQIDKINYLGEFHEPLQPIKYVIYLNYIKRYKQSHLDTERSILKFMHWYELDLPAAEDMTGGKIEYGLFLTLFQNLQTQKDWTKHHFLMRWGDLADWYQKHFLDRIKNQSKVEYAWLDLNDKQIKKLHSPRDFIEYYLKITKINEISVNKGLLITSLN